MLKLISYSDAGHAWLAVKRDLLESLGIADKISGCSYIKGKTVYLEEDCDVSTFINAYKNSINSSLDYMEFRTTYLSIKDKYTEHSPIRRYARYNARIVKDFKVGMYVSIYGNAYSVISDKKPIKVMTPMGQTYTLKSSQLNECLILE